MDEQVKILCVDDERNVLRALERLFLDEDYHLLTALSGQEALEILESQSPIQVVMSDYRMPGMNGVDFLSQVCERWPETVRMVLSGYADTGSVVSAINEGQIYRFIAKPWNDDELKVTLANAVDSYFLHKRNRELTVKLQESNEELQLLNESLERTVRQETEEVLFRNRVLDNARTILDCLPMGIIGLDMDGQIVQVNKMAEKMVAFEKGAMVGMMRQDALPAEVNDCIDHLHENNALPTRVTVSGRTAKVRVVRMGGFGEQSGLVVVLENDG